MLFSKILKRISKIFLYIFLIFNILMASHAYHTSYSYNQGEYPFKKAEEKTKVENIKAALFGAKLSKRTMHTMPAFPYETIKLKADKELVIYETCKHESYYRETEKWKTTMKAFLAKK